MELIQTTPELASYILEKNNRKIVTQYGDKVIWVNLDNDTLFATTKSSGKLYDFEQVQLFICVPKYSKKIY